MKYARDNNNDLRITDSSQGEARISDRRMAEKRIAERRKRAQIGGVTGQLRWHEVDCGESSHVFCMGDVSGDGLLIFAWVTISNRHLWKCRRIMPTVTFPSDTL